MIRHHEAGSPHARPALIRLTGSSSLPLLLLLALIAPAFAQSSSRPEGGQAARLERLRRAAQAKLDELRAGAEFPGATVGFVMPDGGTVSVASGLADVEKKIPLSPSDRMLSGSIGKTYVAAVALQLVQEGKLNLDEKIERWFGREAWFARLPNARDISVRMLMNHTSGIPEHVLEKEFNSALQKSPDKIWAPEELIAYILDRKPLFAAGQGWSYADTNYILVGMIIEKITRRTFYSELDRRILKPLKLTRTSPSDSRALAGLVPGYSRANSPFGYEGRMIIDGRFVLNPQFEWTGGGLVTTAEDLARWAKALYEARAFRKEMLVGMLDAVPAKTGKGDKYGLGVQVRQSDWGPSFGHGGWFPGYISEMEYFPERRIAVAIQFNTDAMRALKRSPRAYIAEIMRVITGEQEFRGR